MIIEGEHCRTMCGSRTVMTFLDDLPTALKVGILFNMHTKTSDFKLNIDFHDHSSPTPYNNRYPI